MKIKLITDSGCDLDPALTDAWNVTVIPIPVHFSEQSYHDRRDLTPGDFFQLLEETGEMPTTSQITPATFADVFTGQLQEYDQLIYIAFSSRLSGIYQSAVLTRQNMEESERITVIDSKSASVGQGLIIKRAAELLLDGATKEEVVATVEDMVNRIEHIFAVGSLEMLKRGGRISSTKAILGNIMNIKPILHVVDGEILPLDKVRGNKKVIDFFLQVLKERGKDLTEQTIGINYATNPEMAKKIEDAIREEYGCTDFLPSEVGAAIGAHAGPNTVGVFFLG
ncbi:MAG: DegV family protein [Halanaerobium sp.]|nr:DegV family protein [Halanaerobium sp.]